MNQKRRDVTTISRKYTCSSVTVNNVIMAIVKKIEVITRNR